MIRKTSQNLPKGVLFLVIASLATGHKLYQEKILHQDCFPGNFEKILRLVIFRNTSGHLLQNVSLS